MKHKKPKSRITKVDLDAVLKLQKDYQELIGDCVEQGVSYNEFTVTEDSDDKYTDVIHYVKEELCFDNDELELVEPFDPKTAFLTELKELMERYQVEIECGGEDVICNKWLKFIFPDEEITYDNEIRRNHKCFPFPITSSNIFDYDK